MELLLWVDQATLSCSVMQCGLPLPHQVVTEIVIITFPCSSLNLFLFYLVSPSYWEGIHPVFLSGSQSSSLLSVLKGLYREHLWFLICFLRQEEACCVA